MMNYIWVGLVVIAVVVGGATGNIQAVLDNIFVFAGTAVEIAVGLIGVMAFFCGLMNVMEKAGLCEKLGKLISPLMRKIFPEVPSDHPANSAMALYFAANILGIGNAATPFGLKAMSELQKVNDKKDTASDAMITFLVLNTAGVTIVPTTILAMRVMYGSANPSEIIVPAVLATACSSIAGLTMDYFIRRRKK